MLPRRAPPTPGAAAAIQDPASRPPRATREVRNRVSTSDWLALASLLVAAAALGVAVYAIVRANATASAATLVTLNEGFRQGWVRCLSPDLSDDLLDYELAELLNLFEIACAIYLDRSLSGNSRGLAAEYLKSALSLLTGQQPLNAKALRLLQDKTTFIFIKKFLNQKPAIISILPKEWYEL